MENGEKTAGEGERFKQFSISLEVVLVVPDCISENFEKNHWRSENRLTVQPNPLPQLKRHKTGGEFRLGLTIVWCGVLSSLSSLVVFMPSGVGVGLECRCMSSEGVSGLVAGGPMFV